MIKNDLYEEYLNNPEAAREKAANDDMLAYLLYEAQGHHYFREKEYPPMEDFLDAWVKNDADALNKYRADCLAVKQKYPKPE